MDYATGYIVSHLFKEMTKMSIMINLFLLVYLLALVLVTILGAVGILTAIFTPEWGFKKSLLIRYHNSKST